MRTALNPEHAHAANCPFCGSDGEYLRYKSRKGLKFDSIGVLEEDYPNVECLFCSFCGTTGPKSEDAYHAVIKWNRRVK